MNRSGASATEFALILPVLLTLIVAMVQVASLVQAHLKSKQAANTMADLVSRCRTVNDADITDDVIAAALTITSTKALPSTVTAFVASASIDAVSGKSAIDWRINKGTSSVTDGMILSNVSTMAAKGDSLIIAGIDYNFIPWGSTTMPPVLISKTSYLSPRLVPKVALGTACDWSL